MVGGGTRVKRVVIAPDSFKGTASAAEAADALAAGWRSVCPTDELILRPMADGGEGTLDAFAKAIPGARRIPVRVRGPLTTPVDTHWVLLPDGTGVIELAASSGITLLDPLAPLDAHTAGFGEAITAALDAGASRLLLGLGGSSSTDGGVGALTALGGRFTDAAGEPIPRGGRGLSLLQHVDLSQLRQLPIGGVIILGDVTNPLLGSFGAATVFGPQKGADLQTVGILENNLARLVSVTPGAARESATAPGAGAAGGTGFGMLTWGATMSAGARLVADAIGLHETLAGTDLVITGEGRFDGQSEAGKAPTEVAAIARAAGIPTALVAGAITSVPHGFESTVSLTQLAGDGATAMADPLRWLTVAGATLGHLTMGR
ncbi:glycerate kinase [Microbacterium sp. NPDC055665]